MIKLAFIIDTIETPNAGTEKQLLLLLEHLDRRQFSPHLITLRQSKWLDQASLSFPIYSVALKRLGSPDFIRAIFDFRKYCRDQQIDIVQTFFRDANIFGTVAAFVTGVKVIISSRRNYGEGYWHNRFWLALLRTLRHLTTGYISNSQKTADYTSKTEKVAPDLISVIYNGIDLDRFESIREKFRQRTRHRLGIAPDQVLIGAVANLRPVKDIPLLVEAAGLLFRKFPQVRFIVLGEGDQRPLLEKRIAESGLTDVFVLAGRQQDVRPYLAAMDVAVLCSKSESLANAIVEYMAAGLPCVVSDVGGNIESIGNTRGLTFASGDGERLRQCLERLVADPALRRDLGDSALRLAADRYCIEKMIQQHETIYRRCALPQAGAGKEKTAMWKRNVITAGNLTAALLTFPLVFLARTGSALGSDNVFIACAQFLSLFPGKAGMFLRRAYYRQTLEHCENDLHLHFGSYISKRGTCIGKKVVIGAYAIVGLVDLGDHVAIGSRSSIMSGRRHHNFEDPNAQVLGQEQFTRIHLGRHAFVGEGSIVMASIGEKSIVGAGSVVVKEIPPLKVAVGNPARVIKDRETAEKSQRN